MFLVILLLINYGVNEPFFVKEFHELTTKETELEYITKYKSSSDVSAIGYVTSIRMKQAKYKFFPWDKLSVFNKEKSRLEELIRYNPKNIHLRYLRLVIQENTPKILNYNSNIKQDKSFIKEFLTIDDKTDYLDKYILKNTSL